MPLLLSESQVINKIASHLYDYLPGKAHPFANQDLSFEGIASALDLAAFWQGGSKLPALTILLSKTLELQRRQFCPLVLEIVRSGMVYRNSKGNPITREDIGLLNELMAKVQFKIPELWAASFLETLPSNRAEEKLPDKPRIDQKNLDELKVELIRLSGLSPQTRGFAFEKFLFKLFELFGLAPRGAFRIEGEQIDGSFEIGTDVYLIEAKWHDKLTGQADLLVFREKVESKAAWSRGLFISHAGFTPDGLEAFSKGRSTNIIGMTAQDIFLVLDGQMSLVDVVNQKARRAAETGEFYVPVLELRK